MYFTVIIFRSVGWAADHYEHYMLNRLFPKQIMKPFYYLFDFEPSLVKLDVYFILFDCLSFLQLRWENIINIFRIVIATDRA